MNKIPCTLIRDLLPSYLEHLTSEETDRLIEEHVSDCAACRETLESMKGSPNGEIDQQDQLDEHRTIDFLKKNRRRNVRILIISLACALLIALAVVFINRYVAGYYFYDPSGDFFTVDLQVNDNTMEVQIGSVQNIYKITGVRFSEQDGAVSMEIRAVPSGFIAGILYGNEYHASYRAEADISEVEANGRIVWHEGKDISMMSSRIFSTAHQYLGDMSANMKTADALQINAWLGPFTNELKTDEKPYVWKLILENDFNESSIAAREEDMKAFGCVMLGMIENLDAVTFEYTVEGKAAEKTITAEQASEILGRDIKDCMDNIDVLEDLLNRTGLDQIASVGQYTWDLPHLSSYVCVTVINNTQEPIKSIAMSVWAGDEPIESQAAENADGSCYSKNALLQMDIDSEKLENAWAMGLDTEISFRVITQDGSTYEVPGRIRIPQAAGFLRDIHITGNAEDGFSTGQ